MHASASIPNMEAASHATLLVTTYSNTFYAIRVPCPCDDRAHMHQTRAPRTVLAKHSTQGCTTRGFPSDTCHHVSMRTMSSVATACMPASAYQRRRRTLRMHTQRMQRGAAEDHAGATRQKATIKCRDHMKRASAMRETSHSGQRPRAIPHARRICRAPRVDH